MFSYPNCLMIDYNEIHPPEHGMSNIEDKVSPINFFSSS